VDTIKYNFVPAFEAKKITAKFFPADKVDAVKTRAHRFMEGNENLFRERVSQKRIRNCHGDVRTKNIFIHEERIYLFGDFEFSDKISSYDVAAEVGEAKEKLLPITVENIWIWRIVLRRNCDGGQSPRKEKSFMGPKIMRLCYTSALILIVFAPLPGVSQERDVGRVVKEIGELFRSDSSYARLEMEIVTLHWERTQRMKAFPPAEVGNTFLSPKNHPAQRRSFPLRSTYGGSGALSPGQSILRCSCSSLSSPPFISPNLVFLFQTVA
jgi:hypothetical protein